MQEDFVELKLGVPGSGGSDPADAWIDIFGRLLALISDVAISNEHVKTTPDFQSQLGEFKNALCGRTAIGPASLEALADACISACEEWFSHSRDITLNREVEIIEIVNVFRATVRKLAGDSEQFNQNMIGAFDRFQMFMETDDLQVLKQRIRAEIRDLNRLVEEKQKTDRASYSKLSARIEILQHSLRRAQDTAMLDPLTQVANRSSFDRTVRDWAASCDGDGSRFTLGMVDLDDFKRINEQFGHQVGDRVLMGAAQLLSASALHGDVVARHGAEEFAILFRDCGIQHAEQRFNRLRSEIAATQYQYRSGKDIAHIRFTISCGVAEFREGETVEDLIRGVDQALYEAKNKGKNCVVTHKKSRFLGLFKGRRSAA